MIVSIDPVITLTFWLWFSISAILIIMEMFFSTSFFMLWLGIVAFFTGGIVWIVPHLNWQTQVLIFAVGSVFSIALWKGYLKTHANKISASDKPHLNRRAEQYIGRTFTLSEPIVNGRGKIQVDDSTWRVEGPDLPVGTQVLVIGVDSVTLKIKPSLNPSNHTGN